MQNGSSIDCKIKESGTRKPAPLLKELEPFFREVMAPDAVATPSFTAATAIRGISVTVLVVATAVETALPAMALVIPDNLTGWRCRHRFVFPRRWLQEKERRAVRRQIIIHIIIVADQRL